MSDVLVVVQAVASGVSALTAAYLVAVTVRRDREAREERERDRRHEQLRRLVDGLGAFRAMLRDDHAQEPDFDIARAEFAAAIALRPVKLPACEALLADDVPKPPYAMGQTLPWDRLGAASDEIAAYSRSLA